MYRLRLVILLRLIAPLFILLVSFPKQVYIDVTVRTGIKDPSIELNLLVEACEMRFQHVRHELFLEDYSSKITKALANVSAYGGGAVILDNGEYPIAYPVRLSSNTCLLGSAMEGDNSTSLVISPSVTSQWPGTGMVVGSNLKFVMVGALTVDGRQAIDGNVPRSGLVISDSKYVWLRNLLSTGHIGDGVQMRRTTNVGIDGLIAKGNSISGLLLDDSTEFDLKRIKLHMNALDGIIILGSTKSVRAETFNLSDNARCAVTMNAVGSKRPSDIILNHGCMERSGSAGMCATKAIKAVLENVSITSNSGSCYAFSGVQDHLLAESVVCDAPKVYSGDLARSKCTNGIVTGEACCPLTCGSCGGAECSKRAPFSACCVKSIRSIAPKCSCAVPPCILSVSACDTNSSSVLV